MGNLTSKNISKSLSFDKKIAEKLKIISTAIEESVMFHADLQDPNKCEQIYVLATNILNKKLNKREITFLRQHQQKSENEIRIINKTNQTKLTWFRKNAFDEKLIEDDEKHIQKKIQKKKNVCRNCKILYKSFTYICCNYGCN